MRDNSYLIKSQKHRDKWWWWLSCPILTTQLRDTSGSNCQLPEFTDCDWFSLCLRTRHRHVTFLSSNAGQRRGVCTGIMNVPLNTGWWTLSLYFGSKEGLASPWGKLWRVPANEKPLKLSFKVKVAPVGNLLGAGVRHNFYSEGKYHFPVYDTLQSFIKAGRAVGSAVRYCRC